MVASTTSHTGAISWSLTVGRGDPSSTRMTAVSNRSTEIGPVRPGARSRSRWMTSLATSGSRSHSTTSAWGKRAEPGSTVTLIAPLLPANRSRIRGVLSAGAGTRMWYTAARCGSGRGADGGAG